MHRRVPMPSVCDRIALRGLLHALVMVVSLISATAAHAEAYDVSAFERSHQLFQERSFVDFLLRFFGVEQDVFLYEDADIIQQISVTLSGPSRPIIELENGIRLVHACKLGECDLKGAMVVDEENDRALFALIGPFCNDGEVAERCDSGQLTLFYRELAALASLSPYLLGWGAQQRPGTLIVERRVGS